MVGDPDERSVKLRTESVPVERMSRGDVPAAWCSRLPTTGKPNATLASALNNRLFPPTSSWLAMTREQWCVSVVRRTDITRSIRINAPSTLSRSKRGVQPLQLHACVSGGELPISFGVFLVSISLPGGDFFGQLVLVGNSPVEALRRQNAEF